MLPRGAKGQESCGADGKTFLPADLSNKDRSGMRPWDPRIMEGIRGEDSCCFCLLLADSAGRAKTRDLRFEPACSLLDQNREATTGMKVATYRIAGERRVGVVDERRKTVSAFDLSLAEAERGVLALVGARSSCLPVCRRRPMSEVELEAPIPTAATKCLLHRQELSRARQGVRLKRIRFERGGRCHAKISDCLLEGP